MAGLYYTINGTDTCVPAVSYITYNTAGQEVYYDSGIEVPVNGSVVYNSPNGPVICNPNVPLLAERMQGKRSRSGYKSAWLCKVPRRLLREGNANNLFGLTEARAKVGPINPPINGPVKEQPINPPINGSVKEQPIVLGTAPYGNNPLISQSTVQQNNTSGLQQLKTEPDWEKAATVGGASINTVQPYDQL